MENDDNTSQYPFWNPDLSLDERVSNLLGLLTTEEKIRFLYHEADDVPRLNIKHYNHGNEALHGVVRPGKATVFPMAIAFAATWDPDLIHEVATTISDEARAKHNAEARDTGPTGLLTFWSPTVNMARDPRWGRTAETYGEDPWLTSRIGVQFVRGLQGDDPNYLKVVSTPKHFAGNNEEHNRHKCNPNINMRDFREYYTPAFKALIVEGQAQSIMGAYNAIFGVPCCQSKFLLTDVLRNEWDFKGYVVTDCGAIGDAMPFLHNYVKNFPAAVETAINAGVDLECGPFVKRYLLRTIKEGKVSEATLNRAVSNVLLTLFKLGLFDPRERCPYNQIPHDVVGNEEHSNLALRVAHESIVLLKNHHADGTPMLPVKKDKIKRIVIVGPNAAVCQFGDYSGSPVITPISPLDGIAQAFPEAVIGHVQWIAPAKKQRFVAIPARNLKPTADCKKHQGLKRTIYSEAGFQGATSTSVDGQVNFDWGRQVTDPSISNAFTTDTGIDTTLEASKAGQSKHVAIKWTGFLCPDVTGEHEISFQSSGMDAENPGYLTFQGKNVGKQLKMMLEAGTSYEISVELPLVEIKSPQPATKTKVRDSKKDPGLVKLLLRAVKKALFKRRQFAGLPSRVSLQWKLPRSAGDSTFQREVAAAQHADVVIACLGLGLGYEREGHDKDTLDLPREQTELVRRVIAVNPETIAVLITGSPVSFEWIKDTVPGILLAWYPGERGGSAIADILTGDVNPGGKLPMTFYRSTRQLTPFNEYDITKGKTYWYFDKEPLYPFGYGLSYTTFEYKNLELSADKVTPSDTITISVRVENTGQCAGDEIVQVYTRYTKTDGTGRAAEPLPRLQLKGFKRVHLDAGETIDIAIDIPVENLALFDTKANKYIVLAGKVDVMVGASSRDIKLVKSIDAGTN